MKILSSPNNKISFSVQTERLLDTLTNCDLGLGTSSFPIPIDSFVTINDPDLYVFHSGEKIIMKFITDTQNEALDFQMVGCKINNIGQDFNKETASTIFPWEGIFITDVPNIIILPDSSLYISPINNECIIQVSNNNSYLIEEQTTTYINYSIIFSAQIQIPTPVGSPNIIPLRDYYFVIDPLIKVTSGGPIRNLQSSK